MRGAGSSRAVSFSTEPRLRIILRAALAILLAAVWLQAAHAHAVLMESVPAADSTMERTPSRIVLAFNEPVRPVFLRVLDARGREVAMPAPRSIDTRVELTLPALADGAYTVSWRVISADAHPIGGSFRFAVGNASLDGSVEDGAAQRALVWDGVWALIRALFLFAMLSAVGGVWFLARLAPQGTRDEARRLTRLWLDAAVLAGVLLIGVQGASMHLAAPADLLSMDLWRSGFATPLGTSLGCAIIALSAVTIALRFVSSGIGLALLALLALAAPASLILTGHVASQNQAVTSMALILHAVVAAFWLGSLWGLARARDLPDAALAALLRVFSRVAMLAVAVLVLAGVALALILVETVSGLVSTRYGLLLLGKIGVVALVLLLALDNKRRLTPAIEAGDGGARRRLARNIRLEIAGIGAIILLTALLGRTPPPRALAETAHAHAGHSEPLTTHATDARGRHAEITITPGRAGRNVVTVRFAGADGAAFTPKEVRLEAALPARSIEPVSRAMTLTPDGARYEGGDLNLPGSWSLRIDALVTEFDKAIFETDVELR